MNVRFLKLLVIVLFLLPVFILSNGFFPETPVSGMGSGGALSAPTSVKATENRYIDKVGIYWDTIKGATGYRIFRNTSPTPAGAVDLGTTGANYFFDMTAVTGQVYFYWIRAENSQTNSPLGLPGKGVRANGSLVPGPFNPLDPPQIPVGNDITATKAYLGKTLFWDEQLSSTRTVACGTCHRSFSGGSDPRTGLNVPLSTNPGPDGSFSTPDDIFGSRGVPSNNADGTYNLSPVYGFREQVTGRKAPSYLNAGYSPNGLFWDGRALDVFRDPLTDQVILGMWGGLESQVLGPPVSDAEMAHAGRDWNDVAARIANSKPLALATKVPPALRNWIAGRTYPQLFEEAFGTPQVTPARIAMAIATHERALFSDQTPFDLSVSQIQNLTPLEEQGKQLFVQLQCNACHGGALLTDQNFHNIGVRPQSEDGGRFNVTGLEEDRARFKTPPLRNVELHAPYMHNGRFATLEEVVEFYNRGGDFDATNIDHGVIRPLNLSQDEKDQLVAFLKRPMTDERVRNELPPFDRPRLYTESVRVPGINGAGTNGSGGIIPEPVAIEPPFSGNPSFTVGVSKGLGGAEAVLAIDSNDPGTSAIPGTADFARLTITLSGTGAGQGFGSVSINIPAANAQWIGKTFTGRWYITDPQAQNGFSVSPAFTFTVFSQSASIIKPHTDFDGDGRTDISIFRTPVGQWWYYRSSDGGNSAFQFGSSTDRIVPADYTGDGKTDVAIFRPSSGEWFVLRSEDSSFYSFPFGASTDIPAPGDFDGDGKADPTVFRPSTATWFTQASSQGTLIRSFGSSGDIPQVGDYDGDGRDDLAIFRPGDGSWWLDRSSAGLIVYTFGVGGDKPVIGDYTGDGKTDVAFWRPTTGEWFILRSEDASFYSAPFGAMGDIAAPGDYDGDGKFDLAVFRPSEATWYVSQTRDGFLIQAFGSPEDYPAPAAYVP
ncbi:MAG: cytochrome c peroxidase [Pyrinomonadaceae bacterium]